MPQQPSIVDLTRLSLPHGGAATLHVPVHPGPLDLGGQAYENEPEAVDARIDVSRTSSGYALRLRLTLSLRGPCQRCLEDAAIEIAVDAREVDQPDLGDEELLSPYVDEGQLDVGHWAHDAVALALPGQILCRTECAGLCPVCGASLNDADPEAHRHEEGGDPRWAKLRELNLE